MSDITDAGPRLKAMNDALEESMRPDPDACTDPVLLAAEVRRLQSVIAALADQDVTLSVQGGNLTVTMDATLTNEEREAVRFCVTASLPETEKLGGVAGKLCRIHAATLRGLLDRLGGEHD